MGKTSKNHPWSSFPDKPARRAASTKPQDLRDHHLPMVRGGGSNFLRAQGLRVLGGRLSHRWLPKSKSKPPGTVRSVYHPAPHNKATLPRLPCKKGDRLVSEIPSCEHRSLCGMMEEDDNTFLFLLTLPSSSFSPVKSSPACLTLCNLF